METNDFLCPVSHEKFKYPLVLKCGHTFDKDSITKITNLLCPLCKKSFSKNECIPNWILIKHLNLDIKSLDETYLSQTKNISMFDANDAKTEMLKIEIDDRILNNLLNRIKKHAIRGNSSYIYVYNTFFITPRMISSLMVKLRQKEFYTAKYSGFLWYGELYICWDNYYLR